MDSALPKGWTAVGEEQPIAAGALPKGWTAVGEEQPLAPTAEAPKPYSRFSIMNALGFGGPEAQQQTVQDVEDVGRGAARQITGLGELVPPVVPGLSGSMHERAAAATKQLDAGIKDPKLAELGGIGEQALEFTAPVGKVGRLIGKAPEAAGFLARGGRAATRGALEGGAFGTLSGFQTPTGDPNFESALKKKKSNAVVGGAYGALGGAAAGGAGSLAKSGLDLGSKALGGATKEAGEAFRGAVADTTSAASKSAAEKAASETEQVAKLARGEGTDLDFRKRVVERTQERVKDAKAFAEAQGAKAEVAQRVAEQHADRLTAAETAGDRLAQEFADSPRMLPAEVGGRLQETQDRLISAIENHRSEASGFGEALAKDEGQPTVNTGKAIAYIDQKLKMEVTDPNQKALLESLKGQLSTEGNVPGAGEAGGAVKPLRALTLRQADNFRKSVNNRLAAARARVEGNNLGYDKDLQKWLGEIKDIVMTDAAPPGSAYRKALDKYVELSQPLNKLAGKGAAMSGVDKGTQFGDDFVMERGAVLTRLLNKTGQGSDAIVQLIEANPAIRNDLERYFNFELNGLKEAPNKISAAKVRNFLTDNIEALEKSGLKDKFLSQFSKLEGSETEIAQAKQAVESAKAHVSARQEWTKAAENKVSAEQKLREKAVGRLQETQKGIEKGVEEHTAAAEKAKVSSADYAKELDIISNTRTPPKTVASNIKTLTKRLRKDGHISKEQERDLDRRATEILAKYGETEAARNKLIALMKFGGLSLAAYLGLRGSEVASGIHAMNPWSNHR